MASTKESSYITEDMGTKSFVISFDVEISEVARMPRQMQEIFILSVHNSFFICQIVLEVIGAQIPLSISHHRIHSDFVLILL